MMYRKHCLSLALKTIAGCALLLLPLSPAQAAKASDGTQAIAPSTVSPSGGGACGDEMVFDRNSGRMVRNIRIDLVVVNVWMKRTDNGVAIRPTIRNRCPNSTKKRFRVNIDGVTISMGPLAGNKSATGQTILVGNKTSYRVTVDSGRQIREVNERNNSCVATRRSGDAERTHRCR